MPTKCQKKYLHKIFFYLKIRKAFFWFNTKTLLPSIKKIILMTGPESTYSIFSRPRQQKLLYNTTWNRKLHLLHRTPKIIKKSKLSIQEFFRSFETIKTMISFMISFVRCNKKHLITHSYNSIAWLKCCRPSVLARPSLFCWGKKWRIPACAITSTVPAASSSAGSGAPVAAAGLTTVGPNTVARLWSVILLMPSICCTLSNKSYVH